MTERVRRHPANAVVSLNIINTSNSYRMDAPHARCKGHQASRRNLIEEMPHWSIHLVASLCLKCHAVTTTLFFNSAGTSHSVVCLRSYLVKISAGVLRSTCLYVILCPHEANSSAGGFRLDIWLN